MHLQSRPQTLVQGVTLLLLVTTGCGAAIRSAATEAPHAAVPVVVDETLKAGEDARTRERLAQVLATPEMKRAIAEAAKTAVAAALEQASSAESSQHIKELTDVVATALADRIAHDVVPAVLVAARDSMTALGSAKEMRFVENAVASVAATTTRTALRVAAEEIPMTVAPAARESLARELADPQLHQAVNGLVGDATHQVLMSTRQTVDEARADDAATGRHGIIEQMQRMLTMSWVLAVGVAVIGVGVAAWVLRMRRQTKRYRSALLELVARKKKGDDDQDDPARAQRLVELLQ